MRYRISIGQTDEEILNEDFTAVGSWVAGANWTINTGAGTATHTGSFQQAADLLTLPNVFEVGNQYAFEVDIDSAVDGDGIKIFIGDFTGGLLSLLDVYSGVTTVNVDAASRAFSGTSLRLLGIGDVVIHNFIVYKKAFNTPTEEGFSIDTSNIKIVKSTEAEPISVKTISIEEIDLFGANYDYLKTIESNLLAQNPSEFCSIIPTRIEYKSLNNTWSTFYEGNVIFSNRKTNLREKVITVDLENYSNEIINNGLQKEVTINTFNKYWYSGGLQKVVREVEFTDPGGTCQYPKEILDVYWYLRQIIHEISSLSMTLTSPIFTAGTFQYFGISNVEALTTDVGAAPYSPKPDFYTVTASFSTIVADLNKLFNLDGYVVNDFDAPALYLDSYSQLINGSLGLSKDNNVAEFENDISEVYQVIDVGYDKDHNVIDTDANDWHIKKFSSTTRCPNGRLELISGFWASRYALDSFIDLAVNATGLTFDTRFDDLVYIEVFDDLGTFRAGTSSTCGLYNTNIESRDNIDRWETRLKTDYKAVVEETLKVNDPLIRIWSFPVDIDWSEMQDILTNPFYEFTMTSQYDALSLNGQILELSYPLKNESDGQSESEIKLLTP